MPCGLTTKQEKFVQWLIKGKSQREAYKLAYDAKKMKDAVIDVKASQLLKQDKVRVRYEHLRGKVIAKAEEQSITSAVEVLKEIGNIATDDIANYLDFRTEKQIAGYDSDGDPVFKYEPVIEIKNSKSINTKNISEVSISANGTFKFKLYSREAALYKLAELYGLDVIKNAKQKLAEERFKHDKTVDKSKYFLD